MTDTLASHLSLSRKRTAAVFGEHYTSTVDFENELSHRAKIASKLQGEYKNAKELPFFLAQNQGKRKPATTKSAEPSDTIQTKLIEDVQQTQRYLAAVLKLTAVKMSALPPLQ